MIEFFHECNPPTATAQHRRHTRSGATFQPEGTRRAAAMLRAIFEQHAPQEPLRGPVAVSLAWTFPGAGKGRQEAVPRDKRPDLDNLAKLALDAATAAGLWADDAQVADLHLRKFDGGDIQGIAFCAVEMDREGG